MTNKNAEMTEIPAYGRELKTSIVATLAFAVLLCGLYPLVIWGLGSLIFPEQATGSLLRDAQGKIIGSALLAQGFTSEKYFHPRPSAAGSGYDAVSSGGSNLGQTSQKLMDSVKARVEVYRKENGLTAETLIPGDAVTASASGLDPEISLANALLQAPRVARARGLTAEEVEATVRRHERGRDLGILGEPGVNVLLLNLALDKKE
jgi:K+-transporting ATPase ATPase C chain